MRYYCLTILLVLSIACQSKKSSRHILPSSDGVGMVGAKPLMIVAKDGGKGFVIVNGQEKLQPSDFPLSLGVFPISPDKGVHDKVIFQYKVEPGDLGKSLSFDNMPTEFVVSLHTTNLKLIDSARLIDFPDQAMLLREKSRERFCEVDGRLDSDCKKTIQRNHASKRSYALHSVEDFDALASRANSHGLRVRSLKFIIDMQISNLVHFASDARWDLHYSFVRELVEKKPALDRCIDSQKNEFDDGWRAFSRENYDKVEGRRYLSGSINSYEDSGIYTVEFNAGDNISAAQIVTAYQLVKGAIVPDLQLKFRPATDEQNTRLVDATINIPRISLEAPYAQEKTQLLSPGETLGKLVLYQAVNGAYPLIDKKSVALLKAVPNDIDFVGGIISSQFQSPLSHINVLSRNRGTPHLVVKNAADQADIKNLIGKYVRLKVTETTYEITPVTAKQVDDFWLAKDGNQTPFEPALDLSVTTFIDLANASYLDSNKIGAKASNLADLARVDIASVKNISTCSDYESFGLVTTPENAFGIPFYWYYDHLEKSGAKALLETLHSQPEFRNDAAYRKTKLAEVRKKITDHPINPSLHTMLETKIQTLFGNENVRFRSSTNVEDLQNFNGAGLYESKTVILGDSKKTIAKGLRDVWSSLWLDRAWQERDYYKVNQMKSAMGILVHPAFPAEEANGVAVSRNVFDPHAGEHFTYVAAQMGEESIVNPEGNVTPDEYIINWYAQPEISFLRRSSLTSPNTVLSRSESLLLGCYMRAIHKYFKPIFGKDPSKLFAMETEFKIDSVPRQLFIKQARPYIFGESAKPSGECK